MISNIKKSIFTFVWSSVILLLCLQLVFLLLPRYDYTWNITQFLIDYQIVILLFCFSFPIILVTRIFSYHPIGRALMHLLFLWDGFLVAGAIGYFVFWFSVPTLVTFFAIFSIVWFLVLLKKLLFRIVFGIFLWCSVLIFIFLQIPIYPYIVSLDTIISYQPYHITILKPKTYIHILTKNNEDIVFSWNILDKKTKETISFYEQPLSINIFTEDLENKNNDVIARIIFPDMTYLYASSDVHLIFSGHQVVFLKGTWYSSFRTGYWICSWCLSVSNLSWIGNTSQEEQDIKNIYFFSRYQTARKLYEWKFTDKETLEKIIYRKLYIGKLFMPETYEFNFKNFLLYRFVLGKSTYWHNISVWVNIPIKQENHHIIQKEIDFDAIKDGSYKHTKEWFTKTKYLKYFIK